MNRLLQLVVLLAALVAAAGAGARDISPSVPDVRRDDALFGPQYRARPVTPSSRATLSAPESLQTLLYWNAIAIDASGLDHWVFRPGDHRVYGEQLGPGRASRAMAMVHIAMFEAINAIDRRYQSYLDLPLASPQASVDAAIARAAHDTLVALYPLQRVQLQKRLVADLRRLRGTDARELGVALGADAARAVLAARANDGSAHTEMHMDEDYVADSIPGVWRQDPISRVPIALGARWMQVRPFVLQSAQQFRAPPPPALGSVAYAAAYNEAKRLGGDGVHTATERTAEQTEIGIFWAYDGTPSLCAPPRLYNQIARQIAAQMQSDLLQTARLLTLLNVAMADAGIASWESKYYYKFWRPIGGIREGDPGSGPSSLGDGNALTAGDLEFMPLGAPASNLNGPNFTPPFPAYPSGHATFGGALFQTLRLVYGRDDIAFTFVSDELNGITLGSDGVRRALKPRHFDTLSQAEEENGQSRIYLGIHWAFDKTAGIEQGRRIADYTYQRLYVPLQ